MMRKLIFMRIWDYRRILHPNTLENRVIISLYKIYYMIKSILWLLISSFPDNPVTKLCLPKEDRKRRRNNRVAHHKNMGLGSVVTQLPLTKKVGSL